MVTNWMFWGMEVVISEGRNRCERKQQCFVARLEAKKQDYGRLMATKQT